MPNKMKISNDIVFSSAKDIAEFAYEKIKNLNSKEFGVLTIVGFYDEIINILKELMSFPDTSLNYVYLRPEYEKELMLTIDEDFSIAVEEIYSHNKNLYLSYCSDVLIIGNDCCSTIIHKNTDKEATVYCYDYKSDDECDDDDCNVESLEPIENHSYNLSVSTTHQDGRFTTCSYYTSDKLSCEDIDKISKILMENVN